MSYADRTPRRDRRTLRALGQVASFSAWTVACAAFACAAFFAALTVWGLAAAPFVRQASSSFVVACALAFSAVATVAAHGAFRRLLGRRRRGRRTIDPRP